VANVRTCSTSFVNQFAGAYSGFQVRGREVKGSGGTCCQWRLARLRCPALTTDLKL